MRYRNTSYDNGERGPVPLSSEDRQKIDEICGDYYHFNDIDFGDIKDGKMRFLETAYAKGVKSSYLKIIAAFPSNKQRKIILAFRNEKNVARVADIADVSENYVAVTLTHAARVGIDIGGVVDGNGALTDKKLLRVGGKPKREAPEKSKQLNLLTYKKREEAEPAPQEAVKHLMKVVETSDGKVDFTIRIKPIEIGVIIGALHEFRKASAG